MESQLAAQENLLKRVETADAIDADDPDVEALVQKDQRAQTLLHELELRKVGLLTAENSAPVGDKSGDAERVKREIKTLQDEFEKRQGQLVAVVRKRKRSAVEMEVVKLRSSLNIKRQQCDMLANQVDKLKEEAAKFGSSTVNIEMARANLKELESIYSVLNNEREKAKVELVAAPASHCWNVRNALEVARIAWRMQRRWRRRPESDSRRPARSYKSHWGLLA